MGKLADFVASYFDNTPEEVLEKDWDELKKYNEEGPDMIDVITNRGWSPAVIVSSASSGDTRSATIADFDTSYTEQELFLAA